MFHGCRNRAALKSPLLTSFSFSHCLEIINVLIYLTKYSKIMSWTMEQKILCVMTYYKTKSFKQHMERSSSFGSFSRTTSTRTTLIPLLQWSQLSPRRFKWSPTRNVHALSKTLHAAFNWTADIWSMYSRAPLDIFGSCFRWMDCRS